MDGHTGRRTDRLPNGQTDRQADGRTGCQTDRQADCVPGKQIGTQHNTTEYNTIQYNTPWQTDGETDGQTDRRIYIRYCSHCPQCKECDSHKPADQFADVFTRSKADRCLGCQYPSCTHCPGYRHPRAKKAVQISHKIGGKWFCRRSKACEQAAMSARKA
jgi:hypothetical protein